MRELGDFYCDIAANITCVKKVRTPLDASPVMNCIGPVSAALFLPGCGAIVYWPLSVPW